MANLKPEVEKILRDHEEEFMLSEEHARKFHGEDDVKFVNDLKRDFHLLQRHLVECHESLEEDDAEEMKASIKNKLAVSSAESERIQQSDWWWTPAQPMVEEVLREVLRMLEKATGNKVRPWYHKLRFAWKTMAEFVYLGIVFGLFTVASSKFEVIVIAALVLIYNSVTFLASGLGMGIAYLAYNLADGHGRVMRTLKTRVSVSEFEEAEKKIKDLPVYILIHNISIGIGSLIALFHLVVEILR